MVIFLCPKVYVFLVESLSLTLTFTLTYPLRCAAALSDFPILNSTGSCPGASFY